MLKNGFSSESQLSNDIEQFIAASSGGVAQIESTNDAKYWVMTDEAMRVRQYVTDAVEI